MLLLIKENHRLKIGCRKGGNLHVVFILKVAETDCEIVEIKNVAIVINKSKGLISLVLLGLISCHIIPSTISFVK